MLNTPEYIKIKARLKLTANIYTAVIPYKAQQMQCLSDQKCKHLRLARDTSTNLSQIKIKKPCIRKLRIKTVLALK
jgi:hypothetical protein